MSPAATTSGLTSRERVAFQEGCRKGYVVDSSRRRPNLANRWWTRCERLGYPYVRVIRRTRSRTACITVDVLPMRAAFPEATVEKFRNMWAKHAVPGSAFFPGRNWVGFYKLPVQTIEALVPTILRLTFEAEIEKARWRR